MMTYEQIAAVDLGSNSFRLEIGRVVDQQIYSLDTVKDSVRLASGLDKNKILDEAAQLRALATLERFAERLRGFSPGAVRAVATNTLRVAKNSTDFIPRAEAALGFPIEVISGQEEARLIYIGATQSLPLTHFKRLVFDIGGGSTEFIIGQELKPHLMESLYMGCVSYSLRFFPDGKIDKKNFAQAEMAAAREIERIAQNYQRFGWSEAVASSGTARALSDLCEANKLNPDQGSGISRAGLNKLRSLLIRAGSAENLKLDALPVDRLPVLAGGIAIMSAIFSSLHLEHVTYAEGALRLGVLYDQLGRFAHEDMRNTTVQQFMQRYQVDVQQAARVEHVALALLAELAPEHLQDAETRANDRLFLRWAAQLHEIGISIAHSGFHKHGAYIVRCADMPGFSKKDQERLSILLLAQRGKLDKVQALHNLSSKDAIWPLVFCLRIAALFNRSRDQMPLPSFWVKSAEKDFTLELLSDWLLAHPLSAAALDDEALSWARIDYALHIKQRLIPANSAETRA